MLAYALKRLGIAILVALTVSLITFSMIYLSGDPAIALAGEAATQEDIENIRRVYGYDRPIIVQYVSWLGNAIQGDLGTSHYLKTDVSNVIFERLPTTMLLGACALSFALILAIPLGVVAAIRPNSLVDPHRAHHRRYRPSDAELLVCADADALVRYYLAAVADHGNRHLAAFHHAVHCARLLRHARCDATDAGWHARGSVFGLYPHRTRQGPQALHDPLSNMRCATPLSRWFRSPRCSLVFMLGGSIVIETIFAINGLGFLAWESIQRADLPMMQAIVLVLEHLPTSF